MRIGLLVCDHVNPEFLGVSGDYDDMFHRLFEHHPEVAIQTYDAIGGVLPGAPQECDLWLTTGSRHSVNDEEPWIRSLEAFVREVADAGVPFVGICFGHQLLASALGGSVVKTERGWGVGVKTSQALPEVGLGPEFNLLYSHQDQVDAPPPGAEILGWSEHCPVAMMSVGGSMIGIQGHPEFESAYSSALLHARRGNLISESTADEGLASLDRDTDSARLADWILDFAAKKEV